MAIHQLIDLDFTPGIKAEYINQNFDLIKKWITNERLRIGGWGLVEGFEISCDNDTFTVNIGEGIFINQDGEEVEVPRETHGFGPLDFNVVTGKYIVDSEGKIILNEFCYDPDESKYITYNPPTESKDINPDHLTIKDEDGFYVPIVRVLGKSVWVNATQNKGKTLTVTQKVALDRIDSIMLNANGEYEYLCSINSPNPSHVDLGDYYNSFCVGVIYWTIDTGGINSEIFTNHRSFRKIYVDKTNTLYINGEVYKKSKFIYFEEPDETIRELNDLWYDEKSNTLYIWRYRDGDLGWVIVNDHSEIIVKERKVWYPEDNPTDLQTFIFDKDEINLYFVPKSNALTINIDCATLMDDMYDELIIDSDRVSVLRDSLEAKIEELEQKEAMLKLYESERKDIEILVAGFRKQLKELKELYSSLLNVNTLELMQNGAKTGIAKLDKMMENIDEYTAKLENIAVKYTTIKDSIKILEDQIDTLDAIVNGTYVSNAHGFKLKKPLTHAAYVEVTVTHIIRMKPVRETFQRAAIFVKEGNITVSRDVKTKNALLSISDAVTEVRNGYNDYGLYSNSTIQSATTTIEEAISVLEANLDNTDDIKTDINNIKTYTKNLKNENNSVIKEALDMIDGLVSSLQVKYNLTSLRDTLFETAAVYSVGNEQLEVFVDGIKLSKCNDKTEFYEVVDRLTKDEEDSLGTHYVNFIYGDDSHKEKYADRSSQHFRVNKRLEPGQTVSYRISKHVWSYDQLDALLKNVEKLAQDAFDNSATALSLVTKFEERIHEIYTELRTEMDIINTKIKEIEKCYKKGEEIAWEDLPAKIRNNVVGMPIDRFVSAATPTITLNGIRIEKDEEGTIVGGDIFQIFYVRPRQEERILIREGIGKGELYVDYELESSADGKSTIVRLANDLVSNDANLYIVGFKRGLED